MSERRCELRGGTHHLDFTSMRCVFLRRAVLCECGWMGAERASGRSAESGFLAAGGNAGGAPSCDSAELAYIRNGLGEAQERTTLYQWCRTLLRMVDELTLQFRAERQTLLAVQRERDELRAQLASADPQWDATDAAHPAWWRGHDHAAKKFEELVSGLRAKLADAAEFHARIHTDMQMEYARRTKELEAKLTDMTRRWTEQAATIARHQERELELEAKLAERKRAHEGCLDDLESVARRAETAEKKLAEAEKDWKQEVSDWQAATERNRKRAEAAEASVKELEARLVAAIDASTEMVRLESRLRILEAENATLRAAVRRELGQE